jgi:hypothetical protein
MLEGKPSKLARKASTTWWKRLASTSWFSPLGLQARERPIWRSPWLLPPCSAEKSTESFWSDRLWRRAKSLASCLETKECLETGLIEMAPLAYMRGRTLKRCFAILDEAQNATIPQMRMFLTRIGIGSRAIVTGDPTQVDLHPSSKSGFEDACQILANVRGIAQIRLQSKDQMRHPLVQAIIDAYDSRSATQGV